MDRKHLTDEQIIDYVLGKLPTKEHFQTQNHLKYCQQCRQNYLSWHKVFEQNTSPLPSQDLKQNVLKSMAKQKTKSAGKFPYIVVSACLFILMMIGFFHWKDTDQIVQPEEEINPKIDIEMEYSTLFEQDLIKYAIKESNQKIIWLENETFIPSYDLPIHEKELLRMVHKNDPFKQQYVVNDELFFITDRAICRYKIDDKKMICIPIDIEKLKSISPPKIQYHH